jgi:hypothetical protein
VSRKLALCFVAPFFVVACSGSSGNPSQPGSAAATPGVTSPATQAPPTATAVPAAATPSTFTSQLYGYSVTLPAGWHAGAAMLRWDGASAPGHEDGTVDKLIGPATLGAFAFAGPTTLDLDGFAEDTIAWTIRDHADTCPEKKPAAREAIMVGGQPGIFLAWACGILINQAVTVHAGTAFTMVLRDPGVPTATDPQDRAILQDMLDSVVLPS